MPDRIQAITKMLASSPQDVFLHYSLAMELASSGRFEEAVAEFRRCIELDADYLAAYVEAGKSLRSAGKLEDARAIFNEALRLAAAQGQSHIRDHVQQQLDGLAN